MKRTITVTFDIDTDDYDDDDSPHGGSAKRDKGRFVMSFKSITLTIKVARFGMEENKNKTGGAWFAYKMMLLNCIDDLLDAGLSQAEVD